jgi:DNA mismatch repair ATPase MutS
MGLQYRRAALSDPIGKVFDLARSMTKASEYRVHARECRALAARMETTADREQLLSMAAHWEQLARDRIELIRKHPELAVDGEREENQLLAGD